MKVMLYKLNGPGETIDGEHYPDSGTWCVALPGEMNLRGVYPPRQGIEWIVDHCCVLANGSLREPATRTTAYLTDYQLNRGFRLCCDKKVIEVG